MKSDTVHKIIFQTILSFNRIYTKPILIVKDELTIYLIMQSVMYDVLFKLHQPFSKVEKTI